MTIREKKIREINDLRLDGASIGKIVKKTKIRRNTVKKYLRQYGLLDYTYPSGPHVGPPSLIHPYTNSTPDPLNQKIKQWIDQLQTADTKVGNLTRENEQLKQQVTQQSTDLEKTKEEKQNLKEQSDKKDIEKQDLQQKVAQATTDKETEKKENEKLQNKVCEQYERMVTIERKLGEEKSKVVKIEEEKKTIVKEHHDTIESLKEGVTTMEAVIRDLHTQNHDISQDRDKFKDEAERIERKHESDWILNLIVALLSFLGGIVVDRTILPKIQDFLMSWGAEHGINTKDYANLFPSVSGPKPDIYHIHNGATLETNISRTLLCSGAYPKTYGNNTGANNAVFSTQQNEAIHLDRYHINSGINPVINTSDSLYSQAYPPTHGYTGAGYPVFPNPQDDMIQADIQGSGDVTISTYTSGTTQSSGAVMINHIETLNLPQATSSHYVPPPSMSPVYFYSQFTPIPKELIEPYGLIPLKKMDWTQSMPFLCWLFEQLGYKVPRRPKSHDRGGDILLEGYGEKIAIQVKHRMENTGRKALEEALYAKKMHNATKARVISFSSPFTPEALNDVEKSEIELWDLERIIAEMRKHNIYYPIE